MTDARISFVKFMGEISMLNPKDLKGEAVSHIVYGAGIIKKINDRYLEVDFKKIGKKCVFPYPGSFYRYLKLENEELNEEIDAVVEDWKIENEIDKKEELKDRYKKTLQMMEERKKAAELKKQKTAQRLNDRKFSQADTNRNKGGRSG